MGYCIHHFFHNYLELNCVTRKLIGLQTRLVSNDKMILALALALALADESSSGIYFLGVF